MLAPRQLSGPSCACHGSPMAGYGEAAPQRFPAVERALIAYMRAMLQAGQPFWISAALNSNTVSLALLNQSQGMGDAGDGDFYTGSSSATQNLLTNGSSSGGWISSVISAASAIGNAAVSILPNAATIAGAVHSLQTSLGHNGIMVPNTVANAAVNSAQGAQLTMPLILLLGGGLLMMFALRQ